MSRAVEGVRHGAGGGLSQGGQGRQQRLDPLGDGAFVVLGHVLAGVFGQGQGDAVIRQDVGKARDVGFEMLGPAKQLDRGQVAEGGSEVIDQPRDRASDQRALAVVDALVAQLRKG